MAKIINIKDYIDSTYHRAWWQKPDDELTDDEYLDLNGVTREEQKLDPELYEEWASYKLTPEEEAELEREEEEMMHPWWRE